jgi:polyvinyl alcohol dehydrogenase (cytochrome)
VRRLQAVKGGDDGARPVTRRALAAAGVLVTFALIAVGCTDRNPWPGRRTTTTSTTGSTTTTTTPAPPAGNSWTIWGKDLDNSHNANTEKGISVANAAQLKPKWVAELKGDISATPTVADNTVYIPDWGGYLSALDAKTGAVKWQKKVSDYVGFATYFSRTAPAIHGNSLIIGFNNRHSHGGLLNPGGQGSTTTTTMPGGGDHHGNPGGGDDHHGSPTTATTMPGGEHHDDGGDDHHGEVAEAHGAWMASIDRTNGNLNWKVQVEAQTYAVITGNPVVHNGRVLVGVSSNEWDFVAEPGFKCCTFRGSVVSLDAASGRILWQTHTIPQNKVRECDPVQTKGEAAKNCGFSGASVWSTPAIDTATNTLFVGTGQNYTVPDSMRQCIVEARAANRPDGTCTDPENHFDSILAIDVLTGRMKWTKQLLPFDPWNAACVLTPGEGACPEPYGPDYDLISPNLFTANVHGQPHQFVGAGSKSGTYWALDRQTGEEIWHTQVGPGSTLGGIEWGTAFDDQSIYAPIANPYGKPYTAPDGTALTRGSWAALDKGTGRIKWQVANPGARVNSSLGSPAVANGVMFGSSISGTGDTFFGLNAATGEKLWSFVSGGSSISSPAIVDGVVYWGTGYSHLEVAGAQPSNKFYAFSVGGV